MTDANATPKPLPADFSDDQRDAAAMATAALAKAGVSLGYETGAEAPKGSALAVLGKAGSGKTHLLAWLCKALVDAGARQVTGDLEQRPKSSSEKKGAKRKEITFAVVAPTNRAASVLRARGVAATTIHRIIYSPIYDPEYEALAEWLADPGGAERPSLEGVSDSAIDKARETFQAVKSAPAALAAVGLRGSNFITGWKRRDESLSIGLVDESSMLDGAQLDDLQEIFDLVILFGDPAQLAPVGENGKMVFERLPSASVRRLGRVFRQTADNPILELAHALQDEISFQDFEALLSEHAARDARVVVSQRVDCDVMARSPALVWRNATRIRLIAAFRAAHGLADDAMAPGEPLICDGLELPAQNRKRRVDLEQAGLVKGAQAYWLGEGRKPGFARVYVSGAPHPKISVSAIIQIEKPGETEPYFASSARQGAVFLHGAACTVHKAQGGQWPTVQIFAPDLFAAARSGREEDGAPLWRRLAYVAITRAQERVIWATRYALARPSRPLDAEDLEEGPLL